MRWFVPIERIRNQAQRFVASLQAVVVLLLRKRLTRYSTVGVDEFPDELRPRVLYIAGEGENVWAASLICPCGCNQVIELNLLPQVRPRWRVVQHADGTATLDPSVWRKGGCRSHFFLTDGLIHWCRSNRT